MPIPPGPAQAFRERMMKAHNAGSAYGLRTIVGRTPRRYGSPRAPSPHARLLSIGDCGLWRRDRVGGAAQRKPFYSLGIDTRCGSNDPRRNSRPFAAAARAAAALETLFQESPRAAEWKLGG